MGLYRARVTTNLDDKNMGRIKVECPALYGDSESPWCIPCMPLTGVKRGLFSPPNKGDTVWIELEEDDTEKPVYTGGWWTQGNTPTSDPDVEVFTSKSGHQILFQNKAGAESITVLEKHGHKVVLDNNGVTIEAVNKDITLKGTKLTFNGTQIGG